MTAVAETRAIPRYDAGSKVDSQERWPGRVRTPAYLVLSLAGVFADMFSNNAHQLGFPISPDRLCFAGAVLLVVLDPYAWRYVRLQVRPIYGLMIALIALATWSAATYGTLSTTTGFYALLDRLGVVPFIYFVLAPVVFRGRRERDLLAKLLIVIALYLGLTAFFEMVGPTSLVFPRYIMDPNVGIHFGRARGPFTEAVTDGVVMTQAGLVAAWFAPRFTRLWRWLAVAAVAFCALGVLLTLTRAVWIGAPLGVAVAMLLTPRARKFVPIVAAVGVAAVAIALLAVPGLQGEASSRNSDQRSVYDRYNTDEAALRIVEARPLTGVGWLRFIDVENDWIRQNPNYPITATNIEVHNVVLSRAAELGLPGAALWLACVAGGPGFAAVRRRRPQDDDDLAVWRAVGAGGATTWIFASMLGPMSYPLPNLLVWLLAGVVLAPYLTKRRSAGQEIAAASQTVVRSTT